MIKALILGSSGFLGGELVKLLTIEGYSVIGMKNITNFSSPNDYVLYVKNLVTQHKPNLVINCSANQSLGDDSGTSIEIINSNIAGPTIVLSELALSGISTKFISVSTSWQYDENGHYSPLTLYAASKKAFEDLMLYFSNKIPVCAVVLFDTFGEGDARKKVLNLMINTCKNNIPIEMTPGDQVINLIHVNDAAKGIIAASREMKEIKFYSWFLRSKRVLKIKELINLFPKKYRHLFVLGGRNYRDSEIFNIYNDFEVVPNWVHTHNLQDFINKQLSS